MPFSPGPRGRQTLRSAIVVPPSLSEFPCLCAGGIEHPCRLVQYTTRRFRGSRRPARVRYRAYCSSACHRGGGCGSHRYSLRGHGYSLGVRGRAGLPRPPRFVSRSIVRKAYSDPAKRAYAPAAVASALLVAAVGIVPFLGAEFILRLDDRARGATANPSRSQDFHSWESKSTAG